MTQAITSLLDLACQFDAIVLDQWGVLHDGTAPYAGAVAAVAALAARTRLAVLSNSGKRAAPNATRIAQMGFDASLFEVIMTSGEAIWQDIAAGRSPFRVLCPIARSHGDAQEWASGLDVILTPDANTADAILLMGLPDDGPTDAINAVLQIARDRMIPVVCTNPDKASPRADGKIVVSPGALADTHVDAGGEVIFYGKPHDPIFRSLQSVLGLDADRILMVGDSLEHDIAGGHRAGWRTAFVRGGLHAAAFAAPTDDAGLTRQIRRLAEADGAPMPTYTLHRLG